MHVMAAASAGVKTRQSMFFPTFQPGKATQLSAISLQLLSAKDLLKSVHSPYG